MGFCIVGGLEARETVSAHCSQVIAGAEQKWDGAAIDRVQVKLVKAWLAGSLIA
jgi:hypothetical protein